MNSNVSNDAIIEAIRYIRDAPGTVYASDLIPILWGSLPDDEDLVRDKESKILETINCWGTELVHIDTTRTTRRPGMTEYVTNTDSRAVIDALICTDESQFRIHPASVRTSDASNGQVNVWRILSERDKGLATDSRWSHHPILEQASQRFLAVESSPLVLRTIDVAMLSQSIAEQTKLHKDIVIDLSQAYVENFDVSKVIDDLLPETRKTLMTRGFAIRARGAVFVGDQALFLLPQDCPVREADFERAIFACEHVGFDHSQFVDSEKGVNFRDATFTTAVDHVTFDGCEFTDSVELSFEDAVITDARVSFDHARFNGCSLFFYQTIATPTARITFIGTIFDNAEISFADSIMSAILFYDIANVPLCDFSFRHCESLAIENSSLANPLKLAAIEEISLAGSHLNGVLLEVREQDHGRGAHPKSWFLDALEHRDSSDATLAEELAGVKEVFHMMGEYDLEDDAFIRYMRHGSRRNPIVHFIISLLDLVGRFGTSPGRLVLSLGCVILVFFLVNTGLLMWFPGQFTGSIQGSLLADSALLTWGTFVQAGCQIEPSTAAMTAVLLAQTTVGWFFLGYFFVAFTRKTLR